MSIFLVAAIFVLAYVFVWFLIGTAIKDNGIMDVAWGLGFVLLSWLLFFLFADKRFWQFFFNCLVTLWGLRLSIYIFNRNLKKKAEDFRYANWRKDWGKWVVPRAFLQVYLLQGIIMFIVALPIILIHHANTEPSWNHVLEILGCIVFFIGFIWESVADHQLAQFKKNSGNKGKIMMTGLWSLSRHPNYFGEMLVWIGLFLIALPYGNWIILLVSPIVMTFLLTRVSGVPMLEKKYKDNAEYLAYARRTPPFFPSFSHFTRWNRDSV